MVNKIIINADDFGLTESCSKAIAKAFSKNLISSTTACANGDYIEKSLSLAKENGFLDKIGIHINLTEGKPLTKDISCDSFFCSNGEFHGHIDRLKKPTNEQLVELKEEVTAQFERLLSLGYVIDHADSHHHIHTDVFFENTVKDVCFSFGVKKIRLHRNFGDIRFYKRVVKNLYNKKLHRQGFITTDKMGSFEDVKNFPKTIRNYLCEIMVHPDFDIDGQLIDRTDFKNGIPTGNNLEELTDFINGFKLVSYKDI